METTAERPTVEQAGQDFLNALDELATKEHDRHKLALTYVESAETLTLAAEIVGRIRDKALPPN